MRIARRLFEDCGERGIRTLDTLLRYTPLAGERFRPLSHLSGFVEELKYNTIHI